MACLQQLTGDGPGSLFYRLTSSTPEARSDSTRHGGLVVHNRIACLSLLFVFAAGCDTPLEPELDPAGTQPSQDEVIDQLPILGSSMVVHCVPGTSCGQLRFVVDLAGTPGATTRVNMLWLVNPFTSKWNWVDAIAVLDGNGDPTGFSTSTVSHLVQVLVTLGAPAVEPLTLILNVEGSTGTDADLEGAFDYIGTAIEEASGTLTLYEFNGHGVRGGS